MCLPKRSFSRRTGLFRALTTEKNELESNDPLSNLLVAWNLISIWSLIKIWEDDHYNKKKKKKIQEASKK